MEPVLNAFVDGDNVVLVRRKNGKRGTQAVRGEWVAYLKEEQVSSEIKRGLENSQQVRSVKSESGWLRVGFLGPESRKIGVGKFGFFNAKGIQHFEGDVDPVRRFITDHDVHVALPKRCYIDIETDSRVPFTRKEEARVLSWAISDESQKLVASALLEEESDAAERKLLDEFFRVLEDYDQVLAWSGSSFDFPVLGARIDHLKLRVDPRLWLWLDHLLLFKKMNQHVAESSDEKRSMKLDAICQAVLGDGKEVIPPEVAARWPGKSLARLAWNLWEAGGQFREILLRYNEKDALLLPRLEAAKGFARVHDAVGVACSLFPDTSALAPTHQVDGFMLKLGKRKNLHFPTREYREQVDEDQFKGADVMKPKIRGIGEDVHVCDFSGMYPSIIRTWNMSPDTLMPDVPVNGPLPPNVCRSPLTGIAFRTDVQGILVQAIAELMDLRVEWTNLKSSLPPGSLEWFQADARSTAYKVTANSFFGVMGNSFSRYYDRRIGESITQNGVFLIRATIAEVEARGWTVVYSDTDSAMVQGCTRDQFDDFVKWCNTDLYPALIAKQGCVDNFIKVAYEKEFKYIVFVSAKKYIGLFSHYKGKAPKPLPQEGETFDKTKHSQPEVKGLEYKRGDATLLAMKLQERVIYMLMRGERRIARYEDVLEAALEHVLYDDLSIDEVVQSKSLNKRLREYKAKPKKNGEPGTLPIHVTLALQMQKVGLQVEGQRIEWVVTNAVTSPMEVIPADDYRGECDRFYVWENRVYPPTQRLLEAAFPDHQWRRLERLRPNKGRVKPVSKDQTAFGFEEPKSKVRVPPRLRGDAMDKKDESSFVLHISEMDDLDGIKRVLLKHPGKRAVALIVHTEKGDATLLSPLTVDGSEALMKEIIRVREESWFAAMVYPWEDAA